MNIEIRRPRIEDIEQLNNFFSLVIRDTFNKEGIGYMENDIVEEMKTKEQYLKNDFNSKGEERYFLIAIDGENIIGSIEYGPSSELINGCTNNEYRGIVEVGTVFVLPTYQRMGIGNALLNNMIATLKLKGINEFCLDSGYINTQKVWKRKFGDPNYCLKDYWGEGLDHMIWRVRINS